MRVLALALAAVLLLPASVVAQREFIKDYKDGEKAFKNGNDALAEQKFKEARDHPRAPKQGRKVNLSGNFQEVFIPDYYLGVIAARNNRPQEAQALLERALRDGLITQSQRTEFALATSSLERAREQTRLASNVKPNPPPVEPVRPPPNNTSTTPGNTTPANTTPSNNASNTTPTPNVTVTPPPVKPTTPNVTTPPAEPTWMAPFRKSMEASRSALRQGHYTEARGSLAAASSAAGDAASRQQAQALRSEIDQAVTLEANRMADRARAAIARKDEGAAMNEVASLQALSPGHAALAEIRGGIERLQGALQGQAALARIEKLGVKLFLSGNYNESATALKRAVDSGTKSPRIYLFLASSRAAEALLAPQNRRDALVAEARAAYAQARGAAPSDERFISPSILRLLKSS